jgi:small-conductance mechanosensitive channel
VLLILQDETFEIQNETYRGQQYSQIYFARLHMMRTLLYSLVTHWKPHVPGISLSFFSFFFFVELKLIFAFFVRLVDSGFDLLCVLSLIMALNVLILEEGRSNFWNGYLFRVKLGSLRRSFM